MLHEINAFALLATVAHGRTLEPENTARPGNERCEGDLQGVIIEEG
jgi:hypothetical protein